MKRKITRVMLCLMMLMGVSNLFARQFIIETDQGDRVGNLTLMYDGREYNSNAQGEGECFYDGFMGDKTSVTISLYADGGTFYVGENEVETLYNFDFINDSTVAQSDETLKIILPTTSFFTTIEGVGKSVQISLSFSFDNGDSIPNMCSFETNDDGIIHLPLPVYDGTIVTYHYAADGVGSVEFAFGDDVAIDLVYRTLSINLTTAGDAVAGMVFRIGDHEAVTDATGHASFFLPTGTLRYFAYDSPQDDFPLLFGTKNYDYILYDDGYRAFGFIGNTDVFFTDDMTLDIELPTVSFTTTAGGVGRSLDLSIFSSKSDYGETTRNILNFKTAENGEITMPIPAFEVYSSYNAYSSGMYMYDSIYYVVGTGLHSGAVTENTTVALGAFTDVDFVVKTSSGDAVEGINVGISGLNAVTNSQGQATVSIPDGDYDYMVYTSGAPQQLTVNGQQATYLLDDVWNDEPLWNIFAAGEIEVDAHTATMEVVLPITTFNATKNSSSTAFDLIVEGDLDEEYFSMISAHSTSGVIEVLIPERFYVPSVDESYKVFGYKYSVNDSKGEEFIPGSSQSVVLTEIIDFTYTVKADGKIVEGADVIIGNQRDTSDVNGQVHFNLMAGEYEYSVLCDGGESLVIGGKPILYEFNFRFDLFAFVAEDVFVVTENMTTDINLPTTTFTTLLDGVAKSTSVSMSYSDYIDFDFVSDANGILTVLLPVAYVYDEDGYYYYTDEETYFRCTMSGMSESVIVFPPNEYVTLIGGTRHLVSFTFMDINETAIDNARLKCNSFNESTDYYGKVDLYLMDGTYSYTAFKSGTGEMSGSFTVDGDSLDIEVTIAESPILYDNQIYFSDEILVGRHDTINETITNGGKGDLTITGISITGEDAAMFSTSYSTFPVTLSDYEYISLPIVFSPTEGGEVNATCVVSTTELGDREMTFSASAGKVYAVPVLEKFSSSDDVWVSESDLSDDLEWANSPYTEYFAHAIADQAVCFSNGGYETVLFSPVIDLGDSKDNILRFDMALTHPYIDAPTLRSGYNDSLTIIVSTDAGVTWNREDVLRLWDNGAGAEYVFDNIAYDGEEVTLDLSAYSGYVKLAFVLDFEEDDYADRAEFFIDNIFIGNENAASVESVKLDQLFSAFPNPVDNIMQIKAEGACTARLVTITGQVLNTINFTDRTRLDMSGFENGLYLLQISNGITSSTQRIIKR